MKVGCWIRTSRVFLIRQSFPRAPRLLACPLPTLAGKELSRSQISLVFRLHPPSSHQQRPPQVAGIAQIASATASVGKITPPCSRRAFLTISVSIQRQFRQELVRAFSVCF